jgi:TonB family protein
MRRSRRDLRRPRIARGDLRLEEACTRLSEVVRRNTQYGEGNMRLGAFVLERTGLGEALKRDGNRWAVGAALLAAAFVAAPPVNAQQTTPPVPLEQPQPEPPTNQFGLPLEGWVKVRYTVLANGTVSDVRVVDVMPPKLPTKAAVSAVQKWSFTPANAGGEPVDWFNNEALVVFDAENVPLEPSPLFAQNYVQVHELVASRDFDKAKKQNQQLLDTWAMRLNEIGLVQVQAAVVNIGTSDLHDAYEAILRATDPRVPTLQGSELADALRYRFALAVELGHFADSLETHDRLLELAPLSSDDPVATQAGALREALRGDAAILVKGRVNREPWGYAPSRRTFGFADVDGTVRNVELECDRRKVVLDYSADVEWSIPESWGECMLFVNARRNTSFSLVEFP